jgi:hypothetical protein
VPKTSEINKGLFVAVTDESSSMAQYADQVAALLDTILLSFLLALPRSRQGKVRDLFEVSLLGFGGSGVVSSIRGGGLAGRELVTVAELEQNPASVRAPPPGTDGVDVPSWITAKAEGGTPMREALERAHEIVWQHLTAYPQSEQAVVALLTDGQPTTGDILPAAEALKQDALLLTCHFDPAAATRTVLFPAQDRGLNDFAKLLFRASSEIPPKLLPLVQKLLPENAPAVVPGARGLIFGGGFPEISRFFEFATVTQIAAVVP